MNYYRDDYCWDATPEEIFDEKIINVYVIECGNLCKIGISKNVGQRVAALKSDKVVKEVGEAPRIIRCVTIDMSEASEVEIAVHKKLADQRYSGEWFYCNSAFAFRAITDCARDIALKFEAEEDEADRELQRYVRAMMISRKLGKLDRFIKLNEEVDIGEALELCLQEENMQINGCVEDELCMDVTAPHNVVPLEKPEPIPVNNLQRNGDMSSRISSFLDERLGLQ